MPGDLERLPGDPTDIIFVNWSLQLNKGAGIQALKIWSVLCQGLSTFPTRLEESAGLVTRLPTGSGSCFKVKDNT